MLVFLILGVGRLREDQLKTREKVFFIIWDLNFILVPFLFLFRFSVRVAGMLQLYRHFISRGF